MAYESTDGVGMHYQLEVARKPSGGSSLLIAKYDVRGVGYGEWWLGEVVQVGEVAFGPQLGRGPAET
jgi:hypothetical protein